MLSPVNHQAPREDGKVGSRREQMLRELLHPAIVRRRRDRDPLFGCHVANPFASIRRSIPLRDPG